MENYLKFTINQLKVADAALIVFDITDKQTFDSVQKKWIDLVEQNCKPDVVISILANKIDLG